MAVLGNAVAWIFAPLGWGEWRPVVAAITGLIAKETVVSSFGIFYGFAEVAESGQEIWTNLRAAFTPLSSVSFLIFVLLSAPCFAAIGAIKREMNSTKWTLFAVAYMNMLGYVSALIVYQLGMFLQGNPFTVGTAAAIAVMAIFLWLIFRPAPKPTTGSRLEQAEARV